MIYIIMSFQRKNLAYVSNKTNNYLKEQPKKNTERLDDFDLDNQHYNDKNLANNDTNSRDNTRNNSRDNSRNNSRDNTRNNSRDNTRNNSRDNKRNDSSRDNKRNDSRDNKRNDGNDRQKKEDYGGPYASISQKVYREISQVKGRSSGEFIIDEEIFTRSDVGSSDWMYNLNLGRLEFFNRFDRAIKTIKEPPKIQVIDNYYLYQHIYSIKDGVPVCYHEKEISHQWMPEREVYRRKVKRIYSDPNTDLGSYQEYHLIVRIIRFQLNQQIYEIIIPRENNKPYLLTDNFWDMLTDHNFKILKFPSKTNYMIRQALKYL